MIEFRISQDRIYHGNKPCTETLEFDFPDCHLSFGCQPLLLPEYRKKGFKKFL